MGQVLKFSEFIHKKLVKSPISWTSNVIRILLVGFFMLLFFIFIYQFISLDFLADKMVHNAGKEEDTPNPYEFTVSSKYYDKSLSMDIRPLFDVSLFSGVLKTTLAATKAAPAPYKAGTAVATALSTGAVALGLRNLSYGVETARTVTISSGTNSITLESTSKPSSFNDDFEPPSRLPSPNGGGTFTNSPFEEFTVFDNIISVLMCVEVLLVVSLAVIIVAAVTTYVVSSGHKLQGKSNYTLINRLTSYALKAGYLYSFIFTGLACFNLIWSVYFISRLIEIIKILSGN